jgi:glycosyltransferase involved in cell wall biosynthesis
MNPKVSFIVPCYKLGHLLPDCINSILAQTHSDLEILIMDDCSPDNTAVVAQSFTDSRVMHVRNESNLGHLANYNKGIGLAKGEYIWLISADDFLRKPYVLEKYVRLLDDHPNIGYVFCPAMRFVRGQDAGVMESTAPRDCDTVFPGHDFLLRHELHSDCVPAPAALVRRECYEKLSLFPLDMPFCGDWYLWCLFALYHDIGYFAEPMVCRRFHDANITHYFCNDGIATYFYNLLEVPTRIKKRAEAECHRAIVQACNQSLADGYARQVLPPKPSDLVQAHISLDEFNETLPRRVSDPVTQSQIRSKVYAMLGDHYHEQNELEKAAQKYRMALQENKRDPRLWAKLLFLRMGGAGAVLWKFVSWAKSRTRKIVSAKL